MDSPGSTLAPPPTTRLNQDLELMSWDELRREARKLESEIESKLTSYSKFGDAYARSSFLKSGDNPDDSPAVNNDHISSAMAVEFEQLMMRVREQAGSIDLRSFARWFARATDEPAIRRRCCWAALGGERAYELGDLERYRRSRKSHGSRAAATPRQVSTLPGRVSQDQGTPGVPLHMSARAPRRSRD